VGSEPAIASAALTTTAEKGRLGSVEFKDGTELGEDHVWLVCTMLC
jgi:hypothetical protein